MRTTGRFARSRIPRIRAMASRDGAGGALGVRSIARASSVTRSSRRPMSLGSARCTGPMRGSTAVRHARRTFAAVSVASSVRVAFVNGR